MKTERGRKLAAASTLTAFWDTSGIVPLCCHQAQSARARQTARRYARLVVWWATSIEAISSLNRLIREGYLSGKESGQTFARLDHLRRHWNEILSTEEVRELAERLLGRHKLRAGDALQLGAALVLCNNRSRGRHFIGGDSILSDAAEAEGFAVIRLS